MKRIILLAAVAAIFVWTGLTSHAQAAPVIRGQNYAEDIHKICTTPICELSFTAIPAGKYLTVTNVSCLTQTRNAPNIPEIVLHGNSPFNLAVLIPVFSGNRTVAAETIREFFANNQVLVIVTATTIPRIRITTFGNQGKVSSGECTIAGLLKPN